MQGVVDDEHGLSFLDPRAWYAAELQRAYDAIEASPDRVTYVYFASAASMVCKYGRAGERVIVTATPGTSWARYDATELLETAAERLPLLVDQGEADEFLATQLRPELLRAACAKANHPLTLRLHPGYDHSYYFVASFIGEHIAWHARALKG